MPAGDGLSEMKSLKHLELQVQISDGLSWPLLLTEQNLCLFLKARCTLGSGRQTQNLPGGTDAMQKRHEKEKRHSENKRGGRYKAHPPSPIIYIERIERTSVIETSVTSMPGRRKPI